MDPLTEALIAEECAFFNQVLQTCAPDGMELSLGSFAALEALCKGWHCDVKAGALLQDARCRRLKSRHVQQLVPDGFVKILDALLDQECVHLWSRLSLWLEPSDFFYRKGQLSEYSFLIYMKRYFEAYQGGSEVVDALVEGVVRSVQQLGLIDVPLSKVHRGEHRVNEYDRLLHIALRTRNTKAVELLLDAGAQTYLEKESHKEESCSSPEEGCPLFEYQKAPKRKKSVEFSRGGVLSNWSKKALVSGHYRVQEGWMVKGLKWFYKNIWSPDEMLRHWSSKKTLVEGMGVMAAVSVEEYLRYDAGVRQVFKQRGYYIDYDWALGQMLKGRSYVFPVAGRLKGAGEVTFWGQMHQALKDHAEGTGGWGVALKRQVLKSAWSDQGCYYLKAKYMQQLSSEALVGYLKTGLLEGGAQEMGLSALVTRWMESGSQEELCRRALELWSVLEEAEQVRFMKYLGTLCLAGRPLEDLKGWGGSKLELVAGVLRSLEEHVGELVLSTRLWAPGEQWDALPISGGHILLFHGPWEVVPLACKHLKIMVQEGSVFGWSGAQSLVQLSSVMPLERVQYVEREVPGIIKCAHVFGLRNADAVAWLHQGRYDVLLWLAQEGHPLEETVRVQLKEELEYFKQKSGMWQRSGVDALGQKNAKMQTLLEDILVEDGRAQIVSVLKEGQIAAGKIKRL